MSGGIRLQNPEGCREEGHRSVRRTCGTPRSITLEKTTTKRLRARRSLWKNRLNTGKRHQNHNRNRSTGKNKTHTGTPEGPPCVDDLRSPTVCAGDPLRLEALCTRVQGDRLLLIWRAWSTILMGLPWASKVLPEVIWALRCTEVLLPGVILFTTG